MRVPVDATAIAIARREVARVAREHGMETDRIDDLVVAVSEACTNAIEAQERANVTTPVEVTCRIQDSMLDIVVRDRGRGFALDAIRPRPPLAHPGHLDVERGWGIQLMRALVDDVSFHRSGEGTAVVLRCHLPASR